MHWLKTLYTKLRLIGYVIKTPLARLGQNATYRYSCDESLKLSVDPYEAYQKGVFFYRLRDDLGVFEVTQLHQGKSEDELQVVVTSLSEDLSFRISRRLFMYLFRPVILTTKEHTRSCA